MKKVIECRSPVQIQFDKLEEVVKINTRFLNRLPGPDFYMDGNSLNGFLVSAVVSNCNPISRIRANRALECALERMDELTCGD